MIRTKDSAFSPTKKGPGRRNHRSKTEFLALGSEILNGNRPPFTHFPGAKLARKAAEGKIK